MKTKFSKKTLEFLSTAGKQTDPRWLERHAADYERLVKDPFVEFARELKIRLAPVAPGYHFPVQGIGRIKIAANKVGRGDPANKNQLTLAIAKPTGLRFEWNPRLIFGLYTADTEWAGVVVAGGLFKKPTAEQLRAVRTAIDVDPEPFDQLFADRAFRARFKTDFDRTDRISRAPKGFAPDAPKLDWLKLKRFVVVKTIPSAVFTAPTFIDEVTKDFRQLLRLNDLLYRALGEHAPVTRAGLLRHRVDADPVDLER